ncbi:MAG: winged helix DNA-binding domain-containing protein [Anaerolineae bacterium]|nr:winged helix DNA-binding domain-containing protein [Anaerolineae bacterium]
MITLSLRTLNRTTLARQRLLQRETDLDAYELVQHLVALQAQVVNPPYIGLWTRMAKLRRDTVTQYLRETSILRAPFLRSTLHFITLRDYQAFYPTIQPALIRALGSFFGQKGKSLPKEALIAAARELMSEGSHTMMRIKTELAEVAPEGDPDAIAYLVRSYLPMHHAPPGCMWGIGGSPAYKLVSGVVDKPNLLGLFKRYLAAFGPASIKDFQVWTGLTKLKDLIDTSTFVQYRDEEGRELFDLPDHPLSDADMPAPPRLIPEYDNLLLSHDLRTRVIADEYRSKVFLSAGRVIGTFLIDGFVAGSWKITVKKETATLTLTPFAPITHNADQEQLVAESDQLVRWVEPHAEYYQVKLV